MKQLAIRLSQNELRLCQQIFPVDFDVRSLGTDAAENWRLIKDFPSLTSYGIRSNTFIRKAIEASSVEFLPTADFVREADGEANSLAAGRRKTIPLTEEEWRTIEAVKEKHFRNGTISLTVVWMLYNYSAMLAQDATILSRKKSKCSPVMTEANSKTVTLRVPIEMYRYAEMQAKADGVTVGRWLRDTLINIWPVVLQGEPETDFDYDLEVE